jgi:transketolase
LTASYKTMRDVFLEALHERMEDNPDIFFLTADFGAPSLDAMHRDFPGRVINVGIAEQNLINVATGLALEKQSVYAYAIAPFLVMRAFEQIRNNLSLLSQMKELNVNLVGVGAGMSYDLSGPTHHCLEDATIMRVLPNVIFFSPSDTATVREFVTYSLETKKPKYLRLDGKPLPDVYGKGDRIDLNAGFRRLRSGNKLCVISTGFMTHKALSAAERLQKDGVAVAVIDLFMLKTFDKVALSDELRRYETIMTIEEAFVGKGGLDSLVLHLLADGGISVRFKGLGFGDSYLCDVGTRAYLHARAGLDEEGIMRQITAMTQQTP